MNQSKEVGSKVLGTVIQFEYFLLIKRPDGEYTCNARKFLISLVWVLVYRYSKSSFLQVTLKFELE